MVFSFFYTSQLTSGHWEAYTKSFNIVFKSNFTVTHFKDKYEKNSRQDSYHGFIFDGDNIVGGCTAIPWSYNYFVAKQTFALVVDSFIKEEYRYNEFALYDAYKLVLEKLHDDNIPFIIGVPNDQAYSIWKTMASWKDIGILPWYVLPVKFGNVFKKNRFFNISFFIILIFSFLNLVLSVLLVKKRKSRIALYIDESFCKTRFNDPFYIKVSGTPFYYRVENENNIRTVYLMDYDTFSFLGLATAVFKILIRERVDIIIYIGKMNTLQTVLIKVPVKLQPRKFHLCGFETIKNIMKEDIYCFENWDFGLKNFDVR